MKLHKTCKIIFPTTFAPMKSWLKYLTLFILLITFAKSAGAQDVRLTVKVTGIKVIEGSKMMIALYNSEETFFDVEQMYAGASVDVQNDTLSYTFDELPPGTYALALYHDEDDNGEMNRKWYGPPSEGYAFSNNFTSSVRPARFDDAAVVVRSDTTLTVKMVY
jgi:uncharacterized protein (DUF2141 family)